MSDTIKGSIIGALITGVISFLIFILGNFSTQDSIVESLSVRFDSVDTNMSYEQALQAIYEEVEQLKVNNATLEKSINESKTDNATLQSENEHLQSEIDSLKNASNRSEQIALAESYASSGNYEVAIPILNEITEKTEDVNALLKEYCKNYETSIISNSESLANNGNYDEAINIIDEALKIIPSSQILLNEKENITPKYLTEIVECYKANNMYSIKNREPIKMTGNNYGNGIYSETIDVANMMFNGSYSAYAFYNLDGKYKQLSGIIGHIDFSGSGSITEHDAGQVYDAEVSIWGDDKEIITIKLSSNDKAINFNKSIEGVEILEFQIKCSGNSKVGIAEIQIR